MAGQTAYTAIVGGSPPAELRATMASVPSPQRQEEDGRTAAFAFLWVLIGFKVVTMILIFVHLRSVNSLLILVATFWYWLPIIGFLVAGPLIFRYRLMRMRARREQLRRSEWMVEQEPPRIDQKRVRR
jgi:membrane protein YdbS with pleckstrin-like domain